MHFQRCTLYQFNNLHFHSFPYCLIAHIKYLIACSQAQIVCILLFSRVHTYQKATSLQYCLNCNSLLLLFLKISNNSFTTNYIIPQKGKRKTYRVLPQRKVTALSPIYQLLKWNHLIQILCINVFRSIKCMCLLY